jgi:hypothetical protein
VDDGLRRKLLAEQLELARAAYARSKGYID